MRLALCEKAFLQPEDPKDAELLADIVESVRGCPEDTTTQRDLLSTLFSMWNRQLEKIEARDMVNQAYLHSLSDTSITVAIVGGKFTNNLRGIGDELVNHLLEFEGVKLRSYSRNDTAPPPQHQAAHYAHYTDLGELIANLANEKAPAEKIIIVFTIGITGSNGECEYNNDVVSKFIQLCTEHQLISDPMVQIVQTSTYHASPKQAGYEDNLQDNYGLMDYGASKVLQTLQLLEAIYGCDPQIRCTPAFESLLGHKSDLHVALDTARKVWKESPEAANSRSTPEAFLQIQDELVNAASVASFNLFEDTTGDQSLIATFRRLSNRFDVVKIPYMLSNTAVCKRMFIFDPKANQGRDVWDFFKACSLKRFRIVISPKRGAQWHILVIKKLID